MVAVTKCEVEQCASPRSKKPTASDDATPPTRKVRRQEYWKKKIQLQKTEGQCSPGQTRMQKTAAEQLPGRLQIPSNNSGKAAGGRIKSKKREKPIVSQPGLRNGCRNQSEFAITRPQLGEYSASLSRSVSQNHVIEVWRNESRYTTIEMQQQGSIQHAETHVNSTHVVDGVPVRVDRTSIYSRTESTCSQSRGYPSPIDTPATEMSECWPSPGVLAKVGGQFDDLTLSRSSLANDRLSATVAVDIEDKENVKDCPVIMITSVGDVDNGVVVDDVDDGDVDGDEGFVQVELDVALPWDMSKAHLDWVDWAEPSTLVTCFAQGLQRAGTFPCVVTLPPEDRPVNKLPRFHESA